MRATQDIKAYCYDEHICAALNELELEIEAELSARAIADWTGAHGFYQDFTSFEDTDIEYPLDINGTLFTKVQLEEKLNPHQIKQLEEILVECENVDSWKVDEPDCPDYD